MSINDREIKFLCSFARKYGGFSNDEEVIEEIEKRELVEEKDIYWNMIDEIFQKIAGVKEKKLIVRGILSCSNPNKVGTLKEVTNPLFQR